MSWPDGFPIIGLAVIARDEEALLPRLLDSVQPHVDHVVVCDTGSKDRTKEIARERDCIVVEFEWCDDFSAAREASYAALPDDCAFSIWADADDVLVGAEKLHELAAALPPEASGYLFPYDYAQDEAGNCICRLERERLVRRGIGEHWELPIHEVLKVPVEMPLLRSDAVTYVHKPNAERERDPERNYKILAKDLERSHERHEPPNPRTLVYLGTEALALGKHELAERHLRSYLEVGEWDEELCQAAHKLSITLRAQNKLEEAEQAAQLAIKHRPDWADGYLDLAEIAITQEEPQRAERFCRIAAERGAPETLLIINPLEYSYQPQLMLSIALAKLGRIEEAWEETQKALAVTPYREDLQQQAAAIAQEVKVRETERHFLALRELLVRHDENEKAAELMKCAPYYVWDRPAVAQARTDQREMTLHALEPEVYSSYYRGNPNEAPFERQDVPIEKAHETFHRLGFLRQGLAEQQHELAEDRPLRVLDLACNDAWMAANLSLEGHEVDGVEMNPTCVERAEARRAEYPKVGRFVCDDLHRAPEHFEPGTFDAVVLFETIEHVPDPRRTLQAMVEMCRPGGRCYVSTPDGAYERGAIPGWEKVESKGHLRAIRPHELAALMCEVGIVEGFEVPPSRVQVGSFRPREPKGKIVLYAGPAEAMPERIEAEGLGGSETALVKVAEGFARRGYDVRVYAGNPGGEHGLRGDQVSYGGTDQLRGQVLYAPWTEWDPGEEADLFVSSRLPEAFDRTITAERRVLWLHDADYGDRLTAERAERATDVVVLSEFQREHLTGRYPFLANHEGVRVSRNGIETSYFQSLKRKRKPWVVYSSSPDRGLDVLLECWAEIRERVPEAVLKHTYAPVYHRFRHTYPHLQAFHEQLEALQEDLEGVEALGSVGQRELAETYKRARVWAYPSWTTPTHEPFPEISCISAIEAQAAGVVPVTLDYGALPESLATGTRIAPDTEGEPVRLSKAWRRQFIDAVVEGLTDDDLRSTCEKEGRPFAMKRSWDGVVEQWERWFVHESDLEVVDAEVVA